MAFSTEIVSAMCHVPCASVPCWVVTGGKSGRHGNHGRVIRSEQLNTKASWTGITVVNTVSKSAIDVSISDNDSGEHYPLVYVLICQKL